MSLPLAGRTIAISISESPDLAGLGLGEEHLVEAMFEFARYIVQLGGTVAYGGDLRPGGFTVNLLELAKALGERDTPPITSYVAWPLHLDLTQARKDDFKNLAAFIELPEVTGSVDSAKPLPPIDTNALLVWARNLTTMRRRMARDCDARIVLGGKVTGALGAMPGVLEEALTTLREGKPLYVLGGFGGAGRAVWDAITGRPVAALSIDAQEKGRRGYAELVEVYNAWAAATPGEETVDYGRIASELARCGTAGLHSGLSSDQLTRLANTVHGPEMISLVLAGLRARFPR